LIVIFDPKTARGGGQVVLEDLLARLVPLTPTGLVMPDVGRAACAIPDDVQCWSSATGFVASPPPGPLVLVCNANAALGSVWRAATVLRRQGMDVRTVAIVHNYPSTPAKRAASLALLPRLDTAIVVEPGLAQLRKDSVIPPWLSVPPRSAPDDHAGGVRRTGVVKSYARPDSSKGLHLLPEVFGALADAGVRCEVALGDALDGQARYEEQLRRDLAPWLVDGKRTAAWVDPGDIFVVPSVSGEAACLSAQEAMSGGAYVVASRLGLMPYLSPEALGVSTFPVGDPAAATAAIRDVLARSDADFSAACQHNVATIAQRAGRWQDETVRLLLEAQA
jgi:glycosyltransferase involved in cell wall biosynthesis